jgi:hypothetical protein
LSIVVRPTGSFGFSGLSDLSGLSGFSGGVFDPTNKTNETDERDQFRLAPQIHRVLSNLKARLNGTWLC